MDFSLNKNWRVKEKYGVQFRAEMFNAFNHPNFNGFQNAITSRETLRSHASALLPTEAFGTLSNVQSHREIQFGFKFTF